MISDDDRRTLERYVAGLPVEPAALEQAIAARAAERAMVVDGLLRALDAPEPVIRHRVARRAARMDELDPRLGAALAVLAKRDPDELVRAAASDALRAHEQPAVVDDAARARRLWRVRLELRALVPARGASETTRIVRVMPVYGDDAPHLDATLRDDGPDGLRVEIRKLPQAFHGERPVLRASATRGAPLAAIGQAAQPVADDGTVTVPVSPSAGGFEDVARMLRNQADLIVPADG